MARFVFWTLVGAWNAAEVFLAVACNPRIRKTTGGQGSASRARARALIPGTPW